MQVWKMVAGSLAVLLGLCADQVMAQRISSGGGAFGSRTRGGSLSAGTRSLFGSGSSRGGLGSAGGFGTGSAGQVDASDRFLRTNRRTGDFVGSDAQETRSFVGSVGAGSGGGSGAGSRGNQGLRGRGGRSSTANRSSGRGRGRQAEEIRTAVRVGFTTRPAISRSVALRLASRMERSAWIENRSPIEVAIVSGTATLRGVVASEHDRALAERLALLEAGVWTVKNELVVAPAARSRPDSTAPAPQRPSPAVPE